MAVEGRWGTMGSPASVSNASMRIEGLGQVDTRLSNELLQLGHLANLLEGKDFIFLVSVDGQTCRVVPAVF